MPQNRFKVLTPSSFSNQDSRKHRHHHAPLEPLDANQLPEAKKIKLISPKHKAIEPPVTPEDQHEPATSPSPVTPLAALSTEPSPALSQLSSPIQSMTPHNSKQARWSRLMLHALVDAAIENISFRSGDVGLNYTKEGYENIRRSLDRLLPGMGFDDTESNKTNIAQIKRELARLERFYACYCFLIGKANSGVSWSPTGKCVYADLDWDTKSCTEQTFRNKLEKAFEYEDMAKLTKFFKEDYTFVGKLDVILEKNVGIKNDSYAPSRERGLEMYQSMSPERIGVSEEATVDKLELKKTFVDTIIDRQGAALETLSRIYDDGKINDEQFKRCSRLVVHMSPYLVPLLSSQATDDTQKSHVINTRGYLDMAEADLAEEVSRRLQISLYPSPYGTDKQL